jgi:phospholipid/cholesterol/gamma-HCH transport system permease protein
MSGMAILYELAHGAIVPGIRADVRGLRPELEGLLQAFPSGEALAALTSPPPRPRFADEVGAATVAILADARAQVAFVGGLVEGYAAALRRPRTMRWHEVAVVFKKAGVDALPIVSLISLLMGLVIAFEAAQPLAMFGAQIFIADMIGLVMVREFSPIFTAIIFAGRSGSAFAAEIGTMKVNEELNALETMGLDPLRFLVIQRVFAGTMLMPVLAAYSMLLGVTGGVVVMISMGFPFAKIWTQLVGALSMRDVLVGVVKSFVFGTVVAGIACLRGMQTKDGPNAVGDSATRAVVAGILLIIVIDAVFSVLTYVLKI